VRQRCSSVHATPPLLTATTTRTLVSNAVSDLTGDRSKVRTLVSRAVSDLTGDRSVVRRLVSNAVNDLTGDRIKGRTF
jgi:hypothetical protein